MRGGEVVLRILERHPRAAVIFMSGYPDVLERSPGIPKGAEIVTKPFTSSEIVTRIAKALELRRSAGNF
jgi:FixJ family two-component response regulator